MLLQNTSGVRGRGEIEIRKGDWIRKWELGSEKEKKINLQVLTVQSVLWRLRLRLFEQVRMKMTSRRLTRKESGGLEPGLWRLRHD